MAIEVRVRNFQSIEDASITIGGLTVLTGTNNAGKSALFRAVRGAFTNAPGHAFVRNGQPFCTVDLTFDDGQTLTWKKGKGINTYVVNGKVYDKVDRGVPPEVRIFGVDPIQVGDKDLWPQIAPQVTGVIFLLNETGSVIAEAVADVARVNQLTNALKACDSDRRTARAELKARTETATSLAEQRTRFAGLEIVAETLSELDKRHEAGLRLEKALSNLERLAAKHHKASRDVDALRGIEVVGKLLPTEAACGTLVRQANEIAELRGLRDRRQALMEITEGLRGLNEVFDRVPSEERVAHLQKFRLGIGITVDLVGRYERALAELHRADSAREALSGISLDDELVTQIQKYTKGVTMARQFQSRRERALTELRVLEEAHDACVRERDSLEMEVRRLLGSSSECPTCGQDVTQFRSAPDIE
jgi:DNA repair ATPase RecN